MKFAVVRIKTFMKQIFRAFFKRQQCVQ